MCRKLNFVVMSIRKGPLNAMAVYVGHRMALEKKIRLVHFIIDDQ